MTMKSKLMALGLVASVAAIGCGGSGEEPGANNQATTNNGSCNGGKCDEAGGEKPACEGSVVFNTPERFSDEMSAEEINALNDPFANFVLKQGDDCPRSFDEVMAKLREFDNEGSCESGGTAGIKSHVVTETAQIMDKAHKLGDRDGSYRVVTTRKCGSRDQFALTFSLFGAQVGGTPSGAEVMAFDESTGVFNYYEFGRGEVEFFGNSINILEDNLGITDGTSGRCASCHGAGGYVMKELPSPWVHWEGHADTPGAKELVEGDENLGSKATGSPMESLTKSANRKWNETRLAHLKFAGNAKHLLTPVFCPVEVNVNSGASFPDSSTVNVKRSFLFDRFLSSGFGNIGIPRDAYLEAAREIDSAVCLAHKSGNKNSCDRRTVLRDGEGEQIDDVLFLFSFIERAHVDEDYVNKLTSDGVIDKELAADILAVDFTRPVFSDARCGLLEHVPDVSGEDMNVESIRTGLIENLSALEAPSAAEAALLENLTNEEKTIDAHKKATSSFFDVCKSRDQGEFVRDVLLVAGQRRNRARNLSVFEFSAGLSYDDHEGTGSEHFDPETCTVITD